MWTCQLPLASTPWIDDAENRDSIRLTTVLDGMVFEMIDTEIGRTAFDWVTDIGKRLNPLERRFQSGIVYLKLILTPGGKGVLEDLASILSRPPRNANLNR